MWYDKNGNPIIRSSGVFDFNDLQEISRKLWSLTVENPSILPPAHS
jgi:hypothetical protein